MNGWARIVCLSAAIGLIIGDSASAIVITPSSAVSTSNFPGVPPANLVNGSGLTTTGPVTSWTHAPDGGAANMWHAGTQDGGLGGPTGNPPVVNDQAIVFTMPGKVDLTGSYIWQFAQSAGRSLNEFEMLYSTDANINGTYNSLGLFNLAPGGGTAQVAQIQNFNATSVRYVKFNINSAHSGAVNEYVGLSEVRFEGTIVQVLNPRLEINRQTGNITLFNNSVNGDLNFIAYSLLSNTNGSFDQAGWTPIADRDVDSGGSVDPTDRWVKFANASAANNLSEGEVPHGNGLTIPSTNQSLNFGNAWRRTPYQDVSTQFLKADGSFATIDIAYTGNAIPFGDMDGSGTITPADWPVFHSGMGGSYPTLSRAQAYQLGDMDGDLDSDLTDFLIFKTNYDVDNGSGAFDAMIASIPEPSSILLLATVLGAGAFSRFRRQCRTAVILGAIAVLGVQAQPAKAIVLDLSTAPAFYSSRFDATGSFDGAKAFDGNVATRWASAALTANTMSQWIYVDLGQDYQLQSTSINFETSSASTYRILARTAAQGDPGGQGADPNAVEWRQIAGAVGLGGITAAQSPNVDQIYNFNLGTATNVANVGGTLSTQEFGPIARYLMVHNTVESNSGGSLYSIWEATVDAVTPVTPLVLSVNKTSGQIQIKNNGAAAQSLALDGYQILSSSNALNTSWAGLTGSGIVPAGNGTGNGWEKGLASSTSRLEEGFLTGSSALAISGSFPLGQAYNTASTSQDLVFNYSIAGVGIRTGVVQYETGGPSVSGDYNNNGVVDAADYVLWRNGGPLQNDPTAGVGAGDYDYWRSRFGATSGSGAGNGGSVPEPSCLALLGLVAGINSIRRCTRFSA